MKRTLLLVWATCTIAASFVGCNKEEVVEDPYVEANLREATFGEVISEEFLYKIDNPEVVDGLEDILVVKQQNLTQFFTGNGIAGKVDSLKDKSSLTFRVVKNFSPIVHFAVQDIVSPADSVVIPQDRPIAFPRTQDAMTFTPPDDYHVVDMSAFRWNDTEGLRSMIGTSNIRASSIVGLPTRRGCWKGTRHRRGARCRSCAWASAGATACARVSKLSCACWWQPTGFVGGITYKDIRPWDYPNNKICGSVEAGLCAVSRPGIPR
jgi:hypothetical protein